MQARLVANGVKMSTHPCITWVQPYKEIKHSDWSKRFELLTTSAAYVFAVIFLYWVFVY